jgi:N-acetylglucosamine-6-phosphate deacetylase
MIAGACTVLRGGRLVTPDGITEAADVVIRQGRVDAVVGAGSGAGEAVDDVTGMLLAPGMIDLQLNGGWGHDFTTDAASIATVAGHLPATGVTAFLPTIVTAPAERRRAALDAVRTLIGDGNGGAAAVLGLHFEGPLINPDRAGAHQRTHIGRPERAELDAWSLTSGVAIVTIAPEIDGALELIGELTGRGIVVAAGHTACSAEQFTAARRAGMTMVTHLYNAMAPFEHRNPGPVGAALADASVASSIICDGIHVDPVAVRMAWRALGPARTILVTDATAALGVAATSQRLAGVDITVSGDRLQTAGGTLAGSNLTLDRAVRNLIEFTGCSISDAIRTVTANPAAVLRLGDRGTIAAGARADIVVFDDTLAVQATIVGGITVWER